MRMKNKLVFCGLFLLSFVGYAQDSDSLRDRKLELAARTWGFVTFNTQKKISNPDKELLHLIQLSFELDSFSEYQKTVTLWVKKNLKKSTDSLNEFKNIETSAFQWVNDTALLGNTISKMFIRSLKYYPKKTNPQHTFMGAIPQFYRGLSAKNSSLPNKDLRLLACIKYWNIVNYFYAYPENIHKDWDSMLRIFIPQFIAITDNAQYYTTLLRMSYLLGDGHARIYSSWASDSLYKYEFPFEAEVYPNYSIITAVDSLYSNIIHPNDKILEIGNQLISEKIAYWDTLLSTSTHNWFLHTVRNHLFSTTDSITTITVQRNLDTLKITIPLSIQRKKITNNTVYNVSTDSIGYINLGNLQLFHIETMKKQLQFAKVIIIDARSYPNNTLLALSSWLIDEHKLFARHRTQHPVFLGQFTEKDSSFTIQNESSKYNGTILWLIDRSTISQGGFMTLAFMQSSNVITIGRTTAGAIGVTSQFEIPGNTTCRITTSKVLTKDFQSIQHYGLKPVVDFSENEDIQSSEDLIRKSYQYARRISQFKK